MNDQMWATTKVEYAYEAQTPNEVSFRTDSVKFPSGRVGKYVYTEYPFEVCFILPVMADGRFVFIRQYRYPVRRELIEIPAGSPEAGESLTDCAIRETEEEIGLRPTEIAHALEFYPSPGSADMKAHLFIARGLVESEKTPDPDEDIVPFFLEPGRAMGLMQSGQIQQVGAILGLLLFECPDLRPAT